MCGDCNNPFHGLEDDLDSAPVEAFSGNLSAEDRAAGQRLADAEAARYTEKCSSCNGRGRFISYAGRDCGPCFKCKGAGKLAFKTSPEYRAKAAQGRATKADEQRITLQAARQAWIDANPDDFAWMKAKEETFEFAHSMMEAFIKYGHLTERQHATVTRLRLADIERATARKAEAAARVANAPAIDVGAIETAFTHAKGKGIKKPKMKLAGFKFSEAPAHGRNAGALYVVRVSDDQYLGKVQGGVFTRVRECDEATQAEVLAVASDPHNAAIAYGRRTGNCAICGRELTNHASIDLGIGPICAEKYGWA